MSIKSGILFILLALPLLAQAFSVQMSLSLDDVPGRDGVLFTGKERALKLANVLRKIHILGPVLYVNTGFSSANYLSEILKIYGPEVLYGNHTHLHHALSEGEKGFIDEIKESDRILRKLGKRPGYFRYPYLNRPKNKSQKDRIENLLTQLGYQDGRVTIDTFDWFFNEEFERRFKSGVKIDLNRMKEAYIHYVLMMVDKYLVIQKKFIKGDMKHVILFHENDLNALALEDLISALQKKGVSFISNEGIYPLRSEAENFQGTRDRGLIIELATRNGYKLQDEFKTENLKQEIRKIFDEEILVRPKK